MTSLLIYGSWMLCILPTSPSETTVKIINTSSRQMVAGYVWFHQHFCYDSMNFEDMYFTTHLALDALKDHWANIHFWCFFLMSQPDTQWPQLPKKSLFALLTSTKIQKKVKQMTSVLTSGSTAAMWPNDCITVAHFRGLYAPASLHFLSTLKDGSPNARFKMK